jgi:hypothetical protein
LVSLSEPKRLLSPIPYGVESCVVKIDGKRVGNVNRWYGRWNFSSIRMTTRLLFLILFIVVVAAETTPTPTRASQLEVALIGQGSGPYIVPAGHAVQLKIEILNAGSVDVYLAEGDAYLDPSLNGSWELVHSETMHDFHLSSFHSAIWTFNLTMPGKIQAANKTNDMPEVVLLIKITYSTGSNTQQTEQGEFALSVPGAVVQQQSNTTRWSMIALAIVVTVACVLALRRRRVSP